MAKTTQDLISMLRDQHIALSHAESVALTVCYALKGADTTESVATEATLRLGCANELTSALGDIERLIAIEEVEVGRALEEADRAETAAYRAAQAAPAAAAAQS